jgi:hypothetical protein
MAQQVKLFAETGFPSFVADRTDFHSAGMWDDEPISVSHTIESVSDTHDNAVVLSFIELLKALAAKKLLRTFIRCPNENLRRYSFRRHTAEDDIIFLYND